MLEVRRRFEIPAALCAARAREIPLTAQRKIAGRKIVWFTTYKENKMPLLEINQSRYISASVRLDETTAEQVDQYAAFVHASADDVVDKALNYVFSKDRDFQDFLKTPQAKQIASTLRVRKGSSKDAKDEVEPPAPKPSSRAESTASVRVMKAWSRIQFRRGVGTMLRIGLNLTLHPERVMQVHHGALTAGSRT
jgi:hypothetical protein